MKTKYIILLGVVGVGAVGAYMYMKNKQAQNALLAGSLPATNQGGGFIDTTTSGTTTSGITTSGTTTSGTTTSGGSTTPNLSTQSDGVSPSDANINLANATILVGEIKKLDKEYATPFRGEKYIIGSQKKYSDRLPEFKAYEQMRALYKSKREAKVSELAKLGYKLDATGTLVRI
jgi:hypothetical protein